MGLFKSKTLSGPAPEQPPDALMQALHASVPGALVDRTGVANVSASAGAYILVVRLAQSVIFNRAATEPYRFSRGWYAYAGSAHGPGGMRSRLSRHLRPEKRPHWHIDQLTGSPQASAWALPAVGANECDLVARLLSCGQFEVPCPGFGSSDCRNCRSHLLEWMPQVTRRR